MNCTAKRRLKQSFWSLILPIRQKIVHLHTKHFSKVHITGANEFRPFGLNLPAARTGLSETPNQIHKTAALPAAKRTHKYSSCRCKHFCTLSTPCRENPSLSQHLPHLSFCCRVCASFTQFTKLLCRKCQQNSCSIEHERRRDAHCCGSIAFPVYASSNGGSDATHLSVNAAFPISNFGTWWQRNFVEACSGRSGSITSFNSLHSKNIFCLRF